MDALRETDPARIGVHVLVARLGSGGMGQVYLGRSPGGRLVAVKVVREEFLGHPQALARFRREARTVAEVRSAYTARLVDASLEEAPFWLATEYVAGPTLAHAVRERGALPPGTCRALGAALAEGLASVHAQGVTHRDVKPQNVILGAQGPQLIDFGIARGVGLTMLTREGEAPGTPGFTAPEVLLGGTGEAASDVFALGATLAYAATGRPPFGDGTVAGIAYRTVHEPVDAAGVEPGLAALIGACVAKDPGARPSLAEVIRRCAVTGALVDDPVYAELGAARDPLPGGGPGAAPGAQDSVRTHVLPEPEPDPLPGPQPEPQPLPEPELAPAPAPAPDLAPERSGGAEERERTTEYVARASSRRGRRAGTRVALGLALAVAGSVAAWQFPLTGGGGSGSGSGSGGAAAPSGSGGASASASTGARSPGGGAKAPADHIERSRASRERWTLSKDPKMAAFGSGTCNDPAGGQDAPGKGAETSTVSSNTNGVPGETVSVKMRASGAGEPDRGKRPAPYYVSVAVKPPGAQASGALGYTSAPVDLYGSWDSGEYLELTYPEHFRMYTGGTSTPPVPLASDPGDWTVVFYHVEDDPKKYARFSCSGFRVG
ncbi:serine/threonine-protein kinase [Streptomyces sp. G-G2]|uniref:serine/threonine-protein kinase n=1 Tax=Streptomyces sp. G-G2 TaxID=3046201 RepID=UPI0024BB3E50|nr:serine/threonine-protein kinase [Streptomyces sp. G-G2]MDJ0384117.1 serine/threonine-protein kinase [Streptomyces sp. G-G2]